MKSIFRAPSPALVIAVIALIFSMAGTGYAVSKINGATIKNGTVTGAKLKKDTLTGAQIDESKLGKVPAAASADSAANATNATNAAKLAGSDPSAYARSANFVHVFKTMNAGDPDATLVSSGDISVRMNCRTASGSDYLDVYAKTETNGAALVSSRGDTDDPLDTSTPSTGSRISQGINGVSGTYNLSGGYDDTGMVINTASTHVITLLEGASTEILNRGGHTCTFAGTFIVE